MSPAYAQSCDPSQALNRYHTNLQYVLSSAPPDGLTEESVLNLDAGDVTGDGLEDIIVTPFSPHKERFSPRLLVNDGTGGFFDGSSQHLVGRIPQVDIGRQVFIAELNGDGQNDVMIIDTGAEAGDPWPGGQIVLLLSNGDGTLSDATTKMPQVLGFNHGSSLADLDQDGDLDAFVNTLGDLAHSSVFYSLINNGAGTFTSEPQRFSHICREQGCTDWQHYWSQLLDTNGDGYPDLYASNDGLNGGAALVVLNTGSGTFANPVPNAIPANHWPQNGVPESTLVHDVDGDGDEDLITFESEWFATASFLQMLTSTGDGTFLDETDRRLPDQHEIPIVSGPPHLRDLDGDGNLDIVAFSDFKRIHFLLNDW